MCSIYSLFHLEMFYYLMDTINCYIATHGYKSHRASGRLISVATDFGFPPTGTALINFDVICLTGG